MGYGRLIHTNTATITLLMDDQKLKTQHYEFKLIYFRVRELVNKQVNISLKYDQLKLPEMYHTIIKPLSEKVFLVADCMAISHKMNRHLNTIPIELTPRNGMSNDFDSVESSKSKLSPQLVFILLLLRHEYLIQAAKNLVMFELLNTKANVCEILAIRTLREFDSLNLTNQLFLAPLSNELFPSNLRELFNTLELSIISKAYKFLSQPVIVKIVNRFYNGELIFRSDDASMDSEFKQLLPEFKVANYCYERVSFRDVARRVNVVPKYQSLVLNVRLLFLLLTYLLLISVKHASLYKFVQVIFWLIVVNYNLDLGLKLRHIEFRYLGLVVWTYIDLILVFILDACLCLKILGSDYFGYLFSLVPIVLLPRLLLMLDNYKFFNLLVISFQRMAMNLIGLVCLFFTMILGFYFSFIALSHTQSNLEILFNMVKIFFGFTPSVWNNWDDYNILGKVILMAYLFLIEFIISSILAIILSGVFTKVYQNNDEEFYRMQAVNLALAFNQGKLNEKIFAGGRIAWVHFCNLGSVIHSTNYYLRLPLVVAIYSYEAVKTTPISTDKTFNYLGKEYDSFREDAFRHVLRFSDTGDILGDDLAIAKLRMNTAFKRRRSTLDTNRSTAIANKAILGSLPMANTHIKTVQLVLTLGAANIRTASTDLAFIDELLRNKYHKGDDMKWGGLEVGISKETPSLDSIEGHAQILERLNQMELLIRQLVTVGEQYNGNQGLVIDYPVFDSDETFEQPEIYDLDGTC